MRKRERERERGRERERRKVCVDYLIICSRQSPIGCLHEQRWGMKNDWTCSYSIINDGFIESQWITNQTETEYQIDLLNKDVYGNNKVVLFVGYLL